MTKKKDENRKKRLKSLILLLLLTVLMLSTSTYAWFTANRSVSLEAINVHIAASTGLQISTDANEWKTIISNNDITTATAYTTNKNMLPTELNPVSTDGSVANGLLKLFKGNVAGDPLQGGAMALTTGAQLTEAKYTQGVTSGTSPDFVAFDIFLKVDEASTVYLDRGSGVINTSGHAQKYLENAARYAFLIEGNGAPTDPLATLQGYSGATSSIIVEPNYDAHTQNAVTVADQTYSITVTGYNSTTGLATAPVNYLGVKAAISDPIVLLDTNTGTGANASSTYFAAVPISGGTLVRTNAAYSQPNESGYSYYGKPASGGTDYYPIFNLSAGVTKIRVYMWVEGQDIDCENSASGAYLTFNLGFTLDDPTQQNNP